MSSNLEVLQIAQLRAARPPVRDGTVPADEALSLGFWFAPTSSMGIKTLCCSTSQFILGAQKQFGRPAVLVADGCFDASTVSCIVSDCEECLTRSETGSARIGELPPMLRTRMGMGGESWENVSERGDTRAWITSASGWDSRFSARRLADPQFAWRYRPHWDQLFESLAIFARWAQSAMPELGLSGKVSVQLTCYPSNGARYVRHVDQFDQPEESHEQKRILTVIAYVGLGSAADASDGSVAKRAVSASITCELASQRECCRPWMQIDGGQLRAYSSKKLWLPSADSLSGSRTRELYQDIAPQPGRIVAFRSDVVPHEVMPCHRPRFAVSMWMYGRSLPITEHQSGNRSQSIGPTESQACAAVQPKPAGGVANAPSVLSCTHEHETTDRCLATYKGARVCSDVIGESMQPTCPGGKGEASGLIGLAPKESGAASIQDPTHQLPKGTQETACRKADGQAAGQALPPMDFSWKKKRIFVAIPAYREAQCQLTLASLFATAVCPERLRVGICVQSAQDDPVSIRFPHRSIPSLDQVAVSLGNTKSAREKPVAVSASAPSADPKAEPSLSEHSRVARMISSQCRLIHLDASDAAGPVWARHLAFSAYRGEELVLSIDAHMRFRQGWDALLQQQLEDTNVLLRTGVDEFGTISNNGLAIISTYPAAYELALESNSESSGSHAFASMSALTCVPKLAPTEQDETGLLRFGSSISMEEGPPTPRSDTVDGWRPFLRREERDEWEASHFARMPSRTCEVSIARGIAAGFWFGPAEALEALRPDPGQRQVFFGEEQTMYARATAAGIHIVHPTKPLVLHKWCRSDRATFREQQSAWRTVQRIVSDVAVQRTLSHRGPKVRDIHEQCELASSLLRTAGAPINSRLVRLLRLAARLQDGTGEGVHGAPRSALARSEEVLGFPLQGKCPGESEYSVD